MADIVISHTTEDRDRAEVIGRALSAQGLKVWMYRDILGQGGDRDEVAAKIRAATRVIAVWSPAACASAWVLEEARAAAHDHRLINVELQSGMTPRAFQSGLRIDLSAWGGQRADPILEPLAEAIATIVAKEPKPAEKKSLFGLLDKKAERSRSRAGVDDTMFAPSSGVPKVATVSTLRVDSAPPPMPAPQVVMSPPAAAAAEPTPRPASASAPAETPLKIEVFQSAKPKSQKLDEPSSRTKRRRDLTHGHAFGIGVIASVVIGLIVLGVRQYINTRPLTIAAQSSSPAAPVTASPTQPVPSGFSAEPPVMQYVQELDSQSKSIAAADFGSDEWLFTIANSAGAVRGYEATSGKFFQQWQSGSKPLTDVKLDGGARYMAASSEDGAVYLWRLADGNRQRIVLGKSAARKVAWKPDDIFIAMGNDDGVVDIRSPLEGTTPVRHTFDSAVTAIAWRQDGLAIAVGLKSGGISFIDPANGKVIYTAYGHTGAVNALKFSPNGGVLASAGEDGVTKLWNAFDGIGIQNIPTRPCTESELNKEGKCPNLDLVYSPDGTILLVSTQKGEIEGYKAKNGERAVLLRGHQAPVTGLAWSHYDHRIASVDATGKAVYWSSPFEKQ